MGVKLERRNYSGIDQPEIDKCQSPAHAINPLRGVLYSGMRVWEPCAGEGLMVEALDARGCLVSPSDVDTGPSPPGRGYVEHDFLTGDPAPWGFVDAVITNPPWSRKYEFIRRCYEIGKPWAMLMPTYTLGAKAAQRLFAVHGMKLIAMDKRINFKMPKLGWAGTGAQMSVAWFTWRMLDRDAPTIVYYRADW